MTTLPATFTKRRAWGPSASVSRLGHRSRGVSGAVLADFARGLAVMVSAKLPLVEALAVAERQTRDRSLRPALEQVRRDVERGKSLSAALSSHPRIFDALFCTLVEVAEVAGLLGDVLLRLAVFAEKTAALRQKIRMALLYPAVILLVALGAVLFMLTVIVPAFAAMFSDFGAELPAPTQAVIALSQSFTSNWLLIVIVLAGFAFAVPGLKKIDALRATADAIVLRVPFLGSLLAKSESARLCRTLGTMVGAGVGLEQALRVTQKASSNRSMRRLVQQMHRNATRGRTLSSALQDATFFPPMAAHLVRVGEETARLPEMLLHVAEHYESELDRLLDGLTSIIEPVLIVLIGGLVGGLLIALYLPIFDLVGLGE